MGREYIRQVEAMSVSIPPPSIIFSDSFPGVLNWVLDGTGTDYVAEFSTTYYLRGGVDAASSGSAHIKTKATTPTIGDAVQIEKFLPIASASLYELSFAFYPVPIGSRPPNCRFFIQAHYKGIMTWFELSFTRSTGLWYYTDSAGAKIALTNQPTDPWLPLWNLVKIGFDAANGKYRYITVNEIHNDLSGIAGQPDEYSGSQLFLWLGILASYAERQEIYIDQVLLREFT